ncbi:MAG: acetyl-CoA decarbonylase/synthase complex subunit gamma [Candidatus Bipolaricaulaceae bacterium]
MAKRLTGTEVYKLLPRTNCGDCNFPTCMAFAMQVAAKRTSLDQCPHVSAEAQTALGEAQAPPMRTVRIGCGERELVVGGETVMFRHEEKFHHPPGVAVRVAADGSDQELARRLAAICSLRFQRVGEEIGVDMVALAYCGGDGERFRDAARAAAEQVDLSLILLCPDPTAMRPAAEAVADRRPLLWAATEDNWEQLAALAADHQTPLAVRAADLPGLARLVGRLRERGLEDLVLDVGGGDLLDRFTRLVRLRRLAIEKNFRPFGYPTLAFAAGDADEVAAAAVSICKYGGVVVIEATEAWQLLPVLTVRQNIYTDPQKPNAVQPGLYEVGEPGPDAPVLVTTNFALTYFTVANEVENSKVPAYILVVDTEGLGVLNAYADDKLTAERVIKAVSETGVMERVRHGRLVIPGLAAVLRMEVQDESGWEVIVGPEDAAGIPHFLRNQWRPG